eukprot:TRINITY_DN15125_c0_g1_i21.p1 TRINITY_DN15125_c0_g1~~TRINITY_DN15125_c0_g1_i21.p1  ORF type:complete len:248 (+),score=28.38 TRINITY_DN15125_c0_g1_i21:30-746(+)
MIRRPPRSTHCISSAASDVYKRQPLCRRSSGYVIDENSRKMIRKVLESGAQGETILICKCGGIVTISVKEHELTCENALKVCYCENFIGTPSKLIKHIVEEHGMQLLNKFEAGTAYKKLNTKKYIDLTGTFRNDRCEIVYIGSTGKFYCDNIGLQEKTCNRGDDYNCVDCMRLDMKLRSLPKGYLVNFDGTISRYSTTKKAFCCNRKVINGKPACGNGYYCISCEQLLIHKEKYETLL